MVRYLSRERAVPVQLDFTLIRVNHGKRERERERERESSCLSRYFRRRLAVLHRVHAPDFDPVRGSRKECGHGEGSSGGRIRERHELEGWARARCEHSVRVARTPRWVCMTSRGSNQYHGTIPPLPVLDYEKDTDRSVRGGLHDR